MPTTVPRRPNNGAAEAMVAKAPRYRCNLAATERPLPSMAARKSASLQAGLRCNAAKPSASISPNAELLANCWTTSFGGIETLDTAMASSTSVGGAMRLVFRLMNRSMTNAIPTIEHRIRGQIGHPAACTMVNNGNSSRRSVGRDYGAVSR